MNAIDDADDFENALFHFVTAVRVMASDAVDQSREMGHVNAAWEIQHDVMEGAALMNHPINYLDNRQWRSIDDLVATARELPKEALAGHAPLDHAAWDTLRTRAKELLTLLAPAIARNAKYFGQE